MNMNMNISIDDMNIDMNININMLYIYGYGSSEESSTRKMLQELLPDASVMSTHYSQECPEKGLVELQEFVEKHCIDLIVGSSLGGWIAMHVASAMSLPCILINPVTDESLLPTLELVTRESPDSKMLDNYREYSELHPLVDQKTVDGQCRLECWDKSENGDVAALLWSDSDEVIRYEDDAKLDVNGMPVKLRENISAIDIIYDGKHRLTKEELQQHFIPACHKLLIETLPKYRKFYSTTYIMN